MNMAIKNTQTLAIVAICCFFLISFAGAAPQISTINPGNTVFIGEQGLDITAAMQSDTQIGWWASGAAISTSSPDQILPVSNPGSFSVAPSTFSAYTGNWYRLSSAGKADGIAFTVAGPQLSLRVEDTTVNVDVTNTWVPTGDDIRFRIGTNLLSITQRGVSSVPITIKVQSPNGGVYTALANSAGTTTSIVNIPVNTNDYYTASLWDTGASSLYPPGIYTIWAVCNVNSMNNNYNQIGTTISQQVTLLNQNNNPLIVNPGYVTNPTTPVTTTITPTVPASTVMVTTIPVTTTSAPATTITTLPMTTPVETVSPATIVATTAATTPKPTMSPGFDGVLVALAATAGIIAYTKRN
jgi:hypothetical protein